MKRIIHSLLFVFFASGYAAQVQASIFDRYVGVLHHKNTQYDQLARLDFITETEVSGSIRLRAVLVLYFGDFNSTEYTSYDYDHVTYNLLSGTLVFDSTEREINFLVNHFKNRELIGTLRSGAGDIGELKMTQSPTATPLRSLMPTIAGEYRGICDGRGQRLQVQSHPYHPMTTARSDPYTPFIITAQLGENGGTQCPQGAATCITRVFTDADYNFSEGSIDFHSKRGGLNCKVAVNTLMCGTCQLTRTPASDQETTRPQQVPQATPQWSTNAPIVDPSVETLKGTYTGYVHHERRDIYQPMSITLGTYRQPAPNGGGDMLIISLVSTLAFGGKGFIDEAVTTKFDPRPLNVFNPLPVFDRTDHNSDTILKLTKMSSASVEGIWYSRRFGRVGTFLLTRDQPVILTHPDRVIPTLSGTYEGSGWQIEMEIGLADNAPTSADPFYPLTIHGNAYMPDITIRSPVTNSAYDPFTGIFMLVTASGATFVGEHTQNQIRVKAPNMNLFRTMPSNNPMTLLRINP